MPENTVVPALGSCDGETACVFVLLDERVWLRVTDGVTDDVIVAEGVRLLVTVTLEVRVED